VGAAAEPRYLPTRETHLPCETRPVAARRPAPALRATDPRDGRCPRQEEARPMDRDTFTGLGEDFRRQCAPPNRPAQPEPSRYLLRPADSAAGRPGHRLVAALPGGQRGTLDGAPRRRRDGLDQLEPGPVRRPAPVRDGRCRHGTIADRNGAVGRSTLGIAHRQGRAHRDLPSERRVG